MDDDVILITPVISNTKNDTKLSSLVLDNTEVTKISQNILSFDVFPTSDTT
jgi:hypothetical protein